MSANSPVTISEVTTDCGLRAARDLFQAYAGSLEVDLTLQNIQKEMATFPGAYAPPEGALFLAEGECGPMGIVAMRPLAAGLCEMKRLYVRPEHRGSGAGRRLVEAALAGAIARRYSTMVLDTLPTMLGALALYRRLGFREIPPYHESPYPGTLFLGRRLLD